VAVLRRQKPGIVFKIDKGNGSRVIAP